MPKIYKDENVLDAAKARLTYIFEKFDNVYFSISGGKDSSVMVQLASQLASDLGCTFDILFIDMEAQYKATIDHMLELTRLPQIRKCYWVALPLSLRNAVSVIQPKWVCWDKAVQDKWVRSTPGYVGAITEANCPWEWFHHGMEFEDFTAKFAQWYTVSHGPCASGVGIRSDESLNRFRTIVTEKKERLDNLPWTTRCRMKTKPINCWSFFPLYDWAAGDIWGAVAQLGFSFNEIYELMNKNGLSIHEARLCQPYGDDQRNGLDQFKALEYETWERILQRVHGVNYGNIYCRTSLLGNIKSEKPEWMTWQQYSVWLLETLGLYAPELRDHYCRKIRTFMTFYEKTEGIKIADIPDAADRSLESKKKIASWRRIARAIERNDFWMKRLSFGQTKSDVARLKVLHKKYADLLKIENTTDKHLQQLCPTLNKGM